MVINAFGPDTLTYTSHEQKQSNVHATKCDLILENRPSGMHEMNRILCWDICNFNKQVLSKYF